MPPRVRCVVIVLMLVAIVAIQQTMRRATLNSSRQKLVESSAHVVAARAKTLEPQERQADATPPDSTRTAFIAENLKESNTTTCGSYKCFYLNKHNESIGYLVTTFECPAKRIRKKKSQDWFEIHERGWKYAQQLQHDYGVKHFYLDPPETAFVTPKLHQILNQDKFRENSTVLVQKVATAPTSSLFMAVYPSKRKIFYQKLSEFIKNITDKKAFYKQFQKSIDGVRLLLEMEPCLAHDFQVYLDAFGYIHHLDLERCEDAVDINTSWAMNFLKTAKYRVINALGELD